MENIGSFLQEKRKEKGFSIDEISTATRLHANIIKSIESNEFERLGGSGYTKILITTYARALGLSPREIENLLSKAPERESRTNRQPKEVLHPPTILLHKNIFLFFLLIVVIAVLTIVVVNLYKNEKLTFPFRVRGIQEETSEPPELYLPEEQEFTEPEINNIDLNTSFNDTNGDDPVMIADLSSGQVETLNPTDTDEEPDGESGENMSDSENEFRFIFDRTDYLTEYNIVKDRDTSIDYFSRYIGSF